MDFAVGDRDDRDLLLHPWLYLGLHRGAFMRFRVPNHVQTTCLKSGPPARGKIGKAHDSFIFLVGGNGPGVGGFCRAEGPHLAQLLPAAPKFRRLRVALPLATNLGFGSAVADGGVASGQ